jgi:hypothetical protein
MEEEPAQPGGDPVNCGGRQLACRCPRFQRLALVEPPHHHQPVDDAPAPADREAAGTEGERHDVKIDVGGEAAVQRQFGTAGRLPSLKRGEVQIRQVDRLLELEDPITRQGEPRHMRFSHSHRIN